MKLINKIEELDNGNNRKIDWWVFA
jgi:hypothetical protein